MEGGQPTCRPMAWPMVPHEPLRRGLYAVAIVIGTSITATRLREHGILVAKTAHLDRPRKLLVVGAPASGTGQMAAGLAALGLDVIHESVHGRDVRVAPTHREPSRAPLAKLHHQLDTRSDRARALRAPSRGSMACAYWKGCPILQPCAGGLCSAGTGT